VTSVSGVKIGFSTATGIISWVIRLFTGSKFSHTWLLIDESYFGTPFVMEAESSGFQLVPYAVFAQGCTLIEVIDPVVPIDTAVKGAGQWLGEAYDYAGVFGTLWVLLGRWLKRKWHNPLHSSKTLFCSAANVLVLQAAGYPGATTLDPDDTTPKDLYEFLKAHQTT